MGIADVMLRGDAIRYDTIRYDTMWCVVRSVGCGMRVCVWAREGKEGEKGFFFSVRASEQVGLTGPDKGGSEMTSALTALLWDESGSGGGLDWAGLERFLL